MNRGGIHKTFVRTKMFVSTTIVTDVIFRKSVLMVKVKNSKFLSVRPVLTVQHVACTNLLDDVA